MPNSNLLEIKNLQTYFYVRGHTAKALDKVSLTIKSGQTLGLVGESGCGKSVTAHSIMRLIPDPPGKIEGGEIFFEGQDLLKVTKAQMRKIRGNQISMIFQEPMTSLNPVFPVGDQVGEVIRLHQRLSRRETRERVLDAFQLVGIPAAESRLDDYPHQMSGGMRQRVMIAMALAGQPDILIADEPTTALDVTIQAQILELMKALQRQTGTAIIFITHALGVIAEMCDDVLVMYAGTVAEKAPVTELFNRPRHPYTLGLLSAIPRLEDEPKTRLTTIRGMVPSLYELPDGCRFQNRCPYAMAGCGIAPPPLRPINKDHWVSCYLYYSGT